MNLQGRNLFYVTFVFSCFHNKQNAAENLRLVLLPMGTIFAAPNRIFSALYFLIVLAFLFCQYALLRFVEAEMPCPALFDSQASGFLFLGTIHQVTVWPGDLTSNMNTLEDSAELRRSCSAFGVFSDVLFSLLSDILKILFYLCLALLYYPINRLIL